MSEAMTRNEALTQYVKNKNLSEADLSEADLHEADLSWAEGIKL